MVRTAPAAASSSSAAADGVGDDRGGSGASGVDKSGSAEAIAAAPLVSMNPPVKQLRRAEEAAQRGVIRFLHHQMGSPGKTSDTATVQAITTRLGRKLSGARSCENQNARTSRSQRAAAPAAPAAVTALCGDHEEPANQMTDYLQPRCLRMRCGWAWGRGTPLPNRPRGGDCSEGRIGSRRQEQRAAKACQSLSERSP